MQQRINLVPQKPLAERIKDLIPIVFGGMVVFILLIFFSWVQILNIRLADLDKTIARIEEQTNQAAALSTQVTALKKRLQNKNQAIDQKSVQIAALSKIRGQKRKFSQPLSLISSLLPESVRCKTITFKDSNGEIKGTALDYDDLIWLVRNMQSLNVFKQVSLSVTDRATNKEQERIEFTIVAVLA
ncbi:MAG: PilN domain-containing protein [Thermodesulfobacteriota bacterium]